MLKVKPELAFREPRLEDAAEGKTVVVFQAHTNACPGSRAGLGFEKLSMIARTKIM